MKPRTAVLVGALAISYFALMGFAGWAAAGIYVLSLSH